MTTTAPAKTDVDQPTREERAARGKAARAVAPRSSHAEFTRDPAVDPLALLAQQDASRVPGLVPIRYGRMAVSPFTYYRGAALPMAADLASTPRSGLTVQACGDAHLMNFGVFASPERRLVFDINDFDETLPGPWEWDIKRLAASLEVAARENGYTVQQCRSVVLAAGAEYRRAIRGFAASTALAVWYAHADVDTVRAMYADQIGAGRRRKLARNVARAHTKDNLGALRRFASVTDGRLRINPDPPLIERMEDLAGAEHQDPDQLWAQLIGVVKAYRGSLEPERRALLDRYRVVDMAHKVVGVGSVGTRCWMVLLLGNDESDPLFLQAKEAGRSVLAPYAGASRYGNEGRRVVVGQRLMQTVSDVFLGWVRVEGFDGRTRDFYVRQLRDWKGSAETEGMKPAALQVYGRLCAWTLARAHARTGDVVALAAYLGSRSVFEEAIASFASAYADQNEKDHTELLSAITAGKIAAIAGK
ncbi:DUF2252 domain-containing protein [Prauserella cavernicola]|uniref:DUF2252 domain-containing protein n=1 Tax=Prauserella cavernicola TaxID=2800127 RepID=A0A934QVM7_9PSEU|nr:DUF2252 domain-containing protein [Prauserella cavernicola]MBK1787052.1 DUF2252 domain-containing protein [Prauserella cavernicola]